MIYYGSLTPAAHPQITKPHAPRKPVPAALVQLRTELREEKQKGVGDALDKWLQDTNALASELSSKYGRTPRYYLDEMFHRGARMKAEPTKISPYRAWLSHKVQEVNAGTFVYIF